MYRRGFESEADRRARMRKEMAEAKKAQAKAERAAAFKEAGRRTAEAGREIGKVTVVAAGVATAIGIVAPGAFRNVTGTSSPHGYAGGAYREFGGDVNSPASGISNGRNTDGKEDNVSVSSPAPAMSRGHALMDLARSDEAGQVRFTPFVPPTSDTAVGREAAGVQQQVFDFEVDSLTGLAMGLAAQIRCCLETLVAMHTNADTDDFGAVLQTLGISDASTKVSPLSAHKVAGAFPKAEVSFVEPVARFLDVGKPAGLDFSDAADVASLIATRIEDCLAFLEGVRSYSPRMDAFVKKRSYPYISPRETVIQWSQELTGLRESLNNTKDHLLKIRSDFQAGTFDGKNGDFKTEVKELKSRIGELETAIALQEQKIIAEITRLQPPTRLDERQEAGMERVSSSKRLKSLVKCRKLLKRGLVREAVYRAEDLDMFSSNGCAAEDFKSRKEIEVWLLDKLNTEIARLHSKKAPVVKKWRPLK